MLEGVKKEGPYSVEPSADFEAKKQVYFTRIGMSVRDAIAVQKKLGLFEKKHVEKQVKSLERKHQAPEHMMVVTARSEILADLLRLRPEVKNKLMVAAALHDAFKSEERKITAPLGFTYKSFRLAEEAETKALLAAGVPADIAELSHAAGHPVNEAQRKLASDNLSEEDWAWLSLHYVDMSTRGTDWATYDPIEARLSHDEKFYTGFDQSAIGEVEGHPEESGFQAMRRTGKGAEQKIAERLSLLSGREIDPKALLQEVDAEIKKRIEEIDLGDKGDN